MASGKGKHKSKVWYEQKVSVSGAKAGIKLPDGYTIKPDKKGRPGTVGASKGEVKDRDPRLGSLGMYSKEGVDRIGLVKAARDSLYHESHTPPSTKTKDAPYLSGIKRLQEVASGSLTMGDIR